MTFAQFNTQVRLTVYPEGEAESLVANHRLWIIDALIDLQRKVACLRVNHTSYLYPRDSLFHCGASVFNGVKGYIVGLYTLIPSDQSCARVDKYPISKAEMDCVLRDLENCSVCSTDVFPYALYPIYDGSYSPYPYLDYGFNYPGPETDRLCRPTNGVFTIDRNKIWVFPAVQSNEVVVLDYDGLKTDWQDGDVMDSDVFDREVSEAAELYLRAMDAKTSDCDYQRAQVFSNQYALKVADLIHDCFKKNQLPARNYCFSCG